MLKYINIAYLMDALPIMLIGMMGIFVVTAVIILSVMLLNLFDVFSKKKK